MMKPYLIKAFLSFNQLLNYLVFDQLITNSFVIICFYNVHFLFVHFNAKRTFMMGHIILMLVPYLLSYFNRIK